MGFCNHFSREVSGFHTSQVLIVLIAVLLHINHVDEVGAQSRDIRVRSEVLNDLVAFDVSSHHVGSEDVADELMANGPNDGFQEVVRVDQHQRVVGRFLDNS